MPVAPGVPLPKKPKRKVQSREEFITTATTHEYDYEHCDEIFTELRREDRIWMVIRNICESGDPTTWNFTYDLQEWLQLDFTYPPEPE